MGVDSVTWMEKPFTETESPCCIPLPLCVSFLQKSLGLPGQSDAPEPLAHGIPDTLPYAAQSVIIVCFRDAVAGTPIGDTHACGTVLAFPDLCGPFL